MAEWRSMQGVRLLPEIVEQILTLHGDSHGDDDPAYQWTQLRKLSAFQKRRIERYFHDFWLPKLIVTMYIGPSTSFDYKLADELIDNATSPGNETTVFRVGTENRNREILEDDDQREERRSRLRTLLKQGWNKYSVENPNAILRLGEGVLNDSIKGGYIINDTPLSELVVDETASTISFRWHSLFSALFREEMMLRRYTDDMVSWLPGQHLFFDVFVPTRCRQLTQNSQGTGLQQHGSSRKRNCTARSQFPTKRSSKC